MHSSDQIGPSDPQTLNSAGGVITAADLQIRSDAHSVASQTSSQRPNHRSAIENHAYECIALLQRDSRIGLAKKIRPYWRMSAEFEEVIEVHRHSHCKMSLSEAVRQIVDLPEQCGLQWPKAGFQVNVRTRMDKEVLDSETMIALALPAVISEAGIWTRLGLGSGSTSQRKSASDTISIHFRPSKRQRQHPRHKHVVAKCREINIDLDLSSKVRAEISDLRLYPHLRLPYQELINVGLSSFLRQAMTKKACVQRGQLQPSDSRSLHNDHWVSRLAQSITSLSDRMLSKELGDKTHSILRQCASDNQESVCGGCYQKPGSSSEGLDSFKVLEETIKRRLERGASDNSIKWAALHTKKRKAPSTESFAGTSDHGKGSRHDDILLDHGQTHDKEESHVVIDGIDRNDGHDFAELEDESEAGCDWRINAWLHSL